MKRQSKRPAHKHVFTGVLLIFLAIVAILVDGRIRPYGGYDFSQFRLNAWVIMSLITAASVVTLLVAVNRSKHVGRIGMWYSLFLLSILLWAIGDAFSRAAPSIQLYLGWAMLSYVGIMLMCPLFIMFMLSYTQNDRLLYKWTTLGTLLFASGFMIYTIGEGRLIWDQVGYLAAAEGSPVGTGPLYLLYVAYIPAAYLGGLFLLFRYLRKLKDKAARMQAMVMFLGILIPLVAGVVCDLILPMFGVGMPPTALMWMTVSMFIFSYSIFHYGMSAYDPAALAATIVRSVTDGLVVIDNRNVVLQINTAAASLLGTTTEEATGSDWHQISSLYKGRKEFPAAERPDYIDKSYDQTVVLSMDKDIYLQGTRHKVPVAMTISPLEAGTGNGAVVAFRDIARDKEATAIIEHKVEERTAELHRTQTQLMASVNSLKQGYIMTDHTGAVLTMNHAASLWFCPAGHGSREHDSTCTMDDVAASLQGGLDLRAKVALVLKGRRAREYANVAHGSKFFHVYISPIVMDNTPIGTTILVDDVTEARILERSKDEFFSIASHELRTPLTIIRGNAKMITDLYKTTIKDDNVKLMLDDIYDSSVRLIEIVTDFLDVSRLEQGKIKYQLESFSLARTVELIVYEMSPVAKQRGIVMTMHKGGLDALPPVYADTDRVKQVLYNLVGNALKFTQQGSVLIDLMPFRGHIKVAITDTGRGILEENRELLFHKFQQAGGSLLTRDTTKGTGLGLYISRLLVEAMGGKVVLEASQPGKGSTFSFTLPIATKSQQQEKHATELHKAVHNVDEHEKSSSVFAASK